LLFQDPNKI